ncbi:MAG: DinB family protein [Proteobacteria bacterium]|nr:DinB family protein [Pseudomonadota bacterium]
MSTPAQAVMMAAYNEWMNARLYEAAAKLPAAELAKDRGAFFGSILGTLNHLVVGDTLWLKRFAAHPSNPAALDPVRALAQPTALNQVLFTDLAELRARRDLLDKAIVAWAAGLSDADLAHVLHYANSKGIRSQKRFSSLITHFFNHQTHHRGQATTLLFQAGQDVGVTDLLALIPNET